MKPMVWVKKPIYSCVNECNKTVAYNSVLAWGLRGTLAAPPAAASSNKNAPTPIPATTAITVSILLKLHIYMYFFFLFLVKIMSLLMICGLKNCIHHTGHNLRPYVPPTKVFQSLNQIVYCKNPFFFDNLWRFFLIEMMCCYFIYILKE